MRPGARHGIDPVNARRLQTFQGRYEIRHGIRDMMHPLATLGQVSGNRTFRVGWANQFDPAGPGAKRCDLNRLLGEHEPLTARKSKRSVTGQRLVEVGDDHRDMVQPGILEQGRSVVETIH